MKRFHLNCGTVMPPMGVCLFGVGGPLHRSPIVSHCILVESDDGLLLIDTGLGFADLETPGAFMRMMLWFGGSKRDPGETAVAQIEALGYECQDVRHIALTHFNYDHASGLTDFPTAKVHILKDEYDAVLRPLDFNERTLYRREHWLHQPQWVVHQPHGEQWYGFDRSAMVDLGSVSFCFIPLPGHTRGHAGVAIKSDEGWLLHCGDAYTYHGEIDPISPRSAPYARTLRPFVNLNYAFRNIGRHSRRLQELVRQYGDEVTLTNSHDPIEFNKLVPIGTITTASIR
jgi:glyoxylase-like metal-dependent hydrolase (beta-lactamase superfamily II)